jgi:hypothetical protein
VRIDLASNVECLEMFVYISKTFKTENRLSDAIYFRLKLAKVSPFAHIELSSSAGSANTQTPRNEVSGEEFIMPNNAKHYPIYMLHLSIVCVVDMHKYLNRHVYDEMMS